MARQGKETPVQEKPKRKESLTPTAVQQEAKTSSKKKKAKKQISPVVPPAIETVPVEQVPTSVECKPCTPTDLVPVIYNDAPELRRAAQELSGKAKELREHLRPTVEKARGGSINTAKGLSLLEVKYQTLLQYITNLAFFVYLKLDGKSIQNHPVVDSLVELRIVLEKIKPLEQKLKYQIDKLVKTAMIAQTEGADAQFRSGPDPLQFKPNPQNLVADGGMDDEDDSESKNGLYRPPKLAPVVYEEDPSAAKRRQRQEDRVRQRASKSRLMTDLAAEFDERPEEEAADGVATLGGADADIVKVNERDRYEEDNFVRLTMSKKDMKMGQRANQKRLQDDFKNLNDFGSLAGIRAMEEQGKDAFNLLNRRDRRHQAPVSDDEENDGGGRKRKREGGADKFDGLIGSVKKGRNEFNKEKKKIFKKKRR